MSTLVGPRVRRVAFRRAATVAGASVLVALLPACGIGRDLRSYSGTKRPADAAQEVRPVFDEVQAALGGRGRPGETEFESCGGFWKDVQGDPLGVDISPYLVFRQVRLDVTDAAEAVSAMATVRDQLVRSGWRVKFDELPASAGSEGPDSPDRGSDTGRRPLPHVVLRSGDDKLSVSAELAGHTSARPAVDVTVYSGCYRHPDEQ